MTIPIVLNNNPIDANPLREEAPLISHPSGWKKVQRVALDAFDFMEKILWKYVKDSVALTKRVMKVIASACSPLKEKLTPIIAKLGILSLISCLLILKNYPSDVETLIQNIKIKDGEGIALSVLSVIVNPLDFLESFMTTMGSLTAFGVVPAIAFFSLIGLPFAIVLSGYGALKGIYNLIRQGISLSGIPESVTKEGIEGLKKYLENKVTITAEEKGQLIDSVWAKYEGRAPDEIEKKIEREVKILKDRKINALTRHTDKKVVSVMKNLLDHLNENPEDVDTANKALKGMRKIMVRKITLGSIGTAADVAFVVTLVCSAIFPISIFAIPVVAGARAALSLARHHIGHVWIDKGIDLPTFSKAT